MIFNSIYIEEADNKRLIVFSDGNNLIHSLANSRGKTTLLRIMLYSIGYSVPNTKHIKFENCKVESQITLDSGEVLVLCRESRDYIELKQNDSITTYVLPSDEATLHKIIFKANYPELINNLLGIFYFDQEKGWTLLNRGVVIGSIRFNIEELIRGIAEIDCSELYRQKETKRQDLLKYKQMFSVSKYQETIDSENEVIEICYVSAEESWKAFKEEYFGDSPELAEGFRGDNPMGESDYLQIYTRTENELDKIMLSIQNINGVRQINYSVPQFEDATLF